MMEYYLTFRSLTAAMSGGRRLGEVGLHLRPMSTPEALRRKGCGYCLKFTEAQRPLVFRELGKLPYEKLYVHASGLWKELSL